MLKRSPVGFMRASNTAAAAFRPAVSRRHPTTDHDHPTIANASGTREVKSRPAPCRIL